MRLFNPKRLKTVVLAALLAVGVAPALAQSNKKEEPFSDVPVMTSQKPYIPWVVSVLFVAAILGIAMKNPHRTHLD